MKVTDNTKGIKLNENREIQLIMEFHNGARYSFYGQTKKECMRKFKSKFGNKIGFTLYEWNVYDSELLDHVEPIT